MIPEDLEFSNVCLLVNIIHVNNLLEYFLSRNKGQSWNPVHVNVVNTATWKPLGLGLNFISCFECV